MTPAPAVSFVAQGKPCRGAAGASLLDALRREGFEVPSLCHLKGLTPYGACRVCLVEVQRGRKRLLTTSCNFPLQDGLEVLLDTERVRERRRVVLELLLAMAPGAEAVRALAAQDGVTATRLAARSPASDCILCGLCVRVCREGARAEALCLSARGEQKALGTRPFTEFPPECIGCGACAWVCPTGAVSMEKTAVARLKDRWGSARPCRYALLGLLPGSLCENDYRCASCEIDARLVDRAGGKHPVMLKLPAPEDPA